MQRTLTFKSRNMRFNTTDNKSKLTVKSLSICTILHSVYKEIIYVMK